MLTSELHAMTVIELRKLARESGVKLSAGIDKDGIIQRLASALGTDDAGLVAQKGAQPDEAEPRTDAEDMAFAARGKQGDLQDTPLSADVTSVQPGMSRAWGDQSAESAARDEYQSGYRSTLQARPVPSFRQPLRQPAWQQPHPAGGSSRFGPQAAFPPVTAPVRQDEEPRFTEAPAQPQVSQRPLFPQQTMDGYRLGYRAAPTRDYGRQDYRNNYHPQPRGDYQRPSYGAGYQQGGGYPQPQQSQGFNASRFGDVYYNDALYKPVRDQAFSEPYERGQPVPEPLMAVEGKPASGILEILPDGYGFMRSETLLPGKKDIYVSVAAIRRYDLRTGDYVEGKARPQRDMDKFAALMVVDKLNGKEPQENKERLSFDGLVPIYPNRRIILESERNSQNWPMRIVDLIAPIGFGQRAMIVAPPGSGKTVMLRELSRAIKQNDEGAHVMMLLIDERPEAVTEIRDAVGEDAEVFATTFDEAPESQTRVSETMLERAQRLTEQGENVVILLDSLTKLTRAYQATLTQGGRAMTNTVTPAALVRPKRFFGAARNTREGGSLTVIATILVETGSRVDDIIFEEFKGTANMELWLTTPEVNEPMFPVIDMQRSGTKKEDILLSEQEVEGLRAIRTVLGSTTNREALSQLINMMGKTKCNADLFSRLKEWVTMWEKSGYLIRK